MLFISSQDDEDRGTIAAPTAVPKKSQATNGGSRKRPLDRETTREDYRHNNNNNNGQRGGGEEEPRKPQRSNTMRRQEMLPASHVSRQENEKVHPPVLLRHQRHLLPKDNANSTARDPVGGGGGSKKWGGFIDAEDAW